MPRLPFPAVLGAFAVYSYGATTVSASWFLRRDYGLGVIESIGWAGLIFSPWIAVGLVVWTVLRLTEARARAVALLAGLTLAIVPLAAIATTAIDRALRGAGWTFGEVLHRAIDRLPVAILLYTAVVAAGLAAAYWLRADRHRREMQALSDALEVLRAPRAVTPEPPATLIVAVGRRRVPVSPHEIEWVSSAGNYAVVHWRDQEGLVRETLQQLEARLESARFARGHRSNLINLARVADLRPLSDGAWRATMDSGAELVISRTCRDAFLARLGRRGSA
ncbi:LytTR family DNA-binding domain-containing protein [Brevundimonas sp.]|uniref:LytR/AlgR family response regulator transcription factor n=1 Tax=Brevundimonas sp. TaxID=1871086 RepID=UPI002604AC8B|nr:LytTR family DNA-binding domain-containing protein [Brevundimonas sp.]